MFMKYRVHLRNTDISLRNHLSVLSNLMGLRGRYGDKISVYRLQCKKDMQFEAISTQEEIEQNLIEHNLIANVDRGITMAKLLFVTEPDVRLVPNENETLIVYKGQVKQLDGKPEEISRN